MDSDAQAASWHPAMMPNSAADAIAHDAPAGHPQHPSSLPTPPQHDADAAEPATTGQAETTGGDASPVDDSGIEHWLSEEGDVDNSWLDHHDHHGGAPLEEESKDTDGVHPEEDAEPAHDEVGGAPVALSTAAKHSSTMSFTRTVSHDVSWDGDDDDQEWNLSRTDTDPFRFMPPSNRTNSFPVVLPAEHNVEQPVPPSRAEDLMNEAEHEREDEQAGSGSNAAFPPTSHRDLFSGDGDEGDHSASQQYVGGDLQDPAEEASYARYTEGVPLIPHEEETNHAADPEGNTRDLFAEEAGGDDGDLFGNIGGSGATVAEESDPVPGLERKSTMQVIGGLGSKSTGHQNLAMQEAPEEEDEDDEHPGDQEEETQREADHSGVSVQDDPSEDLAAKWEQAFAGDDDDDDFLLEDSPAESRGLDPAAFFGDDDEGFLEDMEDEPAAAPATPPAPAPEPKAQNGRYLPPQQPQPPTSNPYQPVSNLQPPFPAPFAAPTSAPPVNAAQYGAPPFPEPGPSKGDSFVDKGRSGYQSPYDLPMDLVKQPRKRQTTPQMPRTTTAPASPQAAPPRSFSGYGQGPPPSRGSVDSMSPPTSSHSQQGGARLMTKPKDNFFEELPMSNKVRPASRTSQKGLASSQQNTSFAPPQPGPPQASGFGQPLLTPHPTAPPPQQQQYAPSEPAVSDASRLVAPERVSPYAPLHSNASTPNLPPAPPNARYSPAPPTTNGAAPPAASSSRYSPAPSRSSSAGYGATGSPLPPALPHQPRTSSPLAHFGITHDRPKLSPSPMGDAAHGDRRSSSSMYEPRLNRVPSLPPTREVDEEDGAAPEPPQDQHLAPSPELKFSQMAYRPQQTPPPAVPYAGATLSPPKRSAPNHAAQGAPTSPAKQHAPPQRSQTQSPGSAYGKAPAVQTTEPVRRASSVYDPASPGHPAVPAASMAAAVAAPQSRASRPRGISQSLNMVPPTDGHELDPLQRWKGAPVISWGVGGVMVASFPQSVPRYGMNQVMPQILRSPGEVKIRNIKELQPLEERLARFPGPLKGKSKKKETVAWLTTGIEALERNLPDMAFQAHVSHEDKRAVERVLLWKILRLFIEHDGILEGNPAIEKAVRDILSPGLGDGQPKDASAGFSSGATLAPGLQTSSVTEMRADSVDSSAMEQIRNSLLTGDREAAVWTAADRRLWGHALLVANTVSPDLYKKVAQEFVRKEVNATGHNESLAALYEVLAGNHDECVDELVPVHARAGLQLMQTSTASGAARDAMEGLDRWRETLGLVLSNRSTGDTRALNSLGSLLSGYGRAEAAHICFLFARDATVFGGLDDPRSNFVLVGSDHKRQAEQFAKETEALLLSEVYEYGLTLSGAPAVAASSPHLAAYKLQHALTLAEYGYRDKAMAYCDAITAAITAQTRRSPYHHVILEAAVDDLATRLKQAPKEESNSWIPKPSMNKVSSSVWDRFNKFVAGDESDRPAPGAGAAGDAGGASGPFAHISGGTPTISRPPSSAGATGMEMFGGRGSPAYAPPNGASVSPPATRAASRYAPAAARSATSTGGGYEPTPYAPTGRTSGETNHGSVEQPRQGADLSSATSNPYAPVPAQGQSVADGGLGISQEPSYMLPSRQTAPSPYAPVQPPAGSPSPGYGPYDPPQGLGSPYAPVLAAHTAQDAPAEAESSDAAASGYQAPSYGYEPPSMSSFEPPSTSTYEPPSAEAAEGAPSGGYEPPSYQPYGYEPPSYNPDPEPTDEDDGSDPLSRPKPKKKSFMDDDDNDIPALRAQPTQEKTKSEKDRENEEMFRRIAEDEAKRDKEAKADRRRSGGGWGLGGWFGGGGAKKDASLEGPPNKPIRAKLGEASSFYYDPEQKRWINKKAGAEDLAPKTATPPPPRAASSTPPASSATPPPPMGGRGRSAPPMHGLEAAASVPDLKTLSAQHGAQDGGGGGLALPPGAPPAMARSASNMSAPDGGPGVPAAAGGGPPSSAPPSRPATSMSNASSIDDLLGAPAPRKAGGAKKARKSGRYVDVMAK